MLVDLWWSWLWQLAFDLPLSFWLPFLQQLGMLSTLSCCGGFWFCFFFLTGVWTICLWQLGSWKLGVFGNYFSNTAPGHFLRASVIIQAQSLWTEMPVNSGDKIVVTEIVCKKTALFRPPFGSWGDQSLRESLLPGQWNRVECAWANTKDLEWQVFFL